MDVGIVCLGAFAKRLREESAFLHLSIVTSTTHEDDFVIATFE
jgi:hypothetical protein